MDHDWWLRDLIEMESLTLYLGGKKPKMGLILLDFLRFGGTYLCFVKKIFCELVEDQIRFDMILVP